MQVTHVGDNVTHAVIANKQARDFGISNSAEFFNILSNTLYSDKILAVVREVLCNAWDIHIQTGRTDVPVEVTLENDKLVIRDHGTGISDDDIHPIYAVYGNSTKKLDGQQTGGFGLGSKAPFAYVDHFEVTSYHNGTKTIYAVSKSSAEVAGKPSLMPLVSVPCELDEHGVAESGLAVSMAIKHEDRARFKSVIESIAKFGEMNVMLNGSVRLSTIPFSKAAHGFLMTKDVEGISGAQNHRIFIRYGNVVYPVPDHDKIKNPYAQTVKLMERIGNERGYYGRNQPWRIIFQARPDTISVTPSRESLSMTDHTVDSINELLQIFLKLPDTMLRDACVQIERECIEAVWKEGRLADLLTSDNKVPQLFDFAATYSNERDIVKEPLYISNMDQMGRAYMARSYPDFPNFRREDINMRLDVLEKAGLGGLKNRGKIQSFRREYAEHGNVNGQPWFQRVLVNPLMKRLDAIPELSGSKLLVYGDHKDESIDKNGRRRSYHESKRFVEAFKLSKRNLEGYMPFLRNLAVISFNRIDVEERLPNFPVFKNKHGQKDDFFVYVVSRTDKKIDIIRQFFVDQGMTVIDLTIRQDWEHEHVLQPMPKANAGLPKKPRKKGLPVLSELMGTDGRGHPSLRYDRFAGVENMDSVTRIEDPKFVVQFNPRAQSADMFPGLDTESKHAVVRLYGSQGGVTVNDNQFSRFTEELKIPSLKTWLLDKLKTEVLTNPRMQLAFGFSPEKLVSDINRSIIQSSHQRGAMMTLILENPELAIEFGVLNEMTQEDQLLLNMVRRLTEAHNWNWRHDTTVIEMRKHIEAVSATPEVEEVGRMVANSELVELVNISHFSGVFGENPSTSQKVQRSGALDILQFILA